MGMKWGVRNYQPYSTVPRKSGKGGKEIGDAKTRSTRRAEAKANVKKIKKIVRSNDDKVKAHDKSVDFLSKKVNKDQLNRLNNAYNDYEKKAKECDDSINKLYKIIDDETDRYLKNNPAPKNISSRAWKDEAWYSVADDVYKNSRYKDLTSKAYGYEADKAFDRYLNVKKEISKELVGKYSDKPAITYTRGNKNKRVHSTYELLAMGAIENAEKTYDVNNKKRK